MCWHRLARKSIFVCVDTRKVLSVTGKAEEDMLNLFIVKIIINIVQFENIIEQENNGR